MVQNKVCVFVVVFVKVFYFLEIEYIGVNVVKGLGQGCFMIFLVVDGLWVCFLKQNDVVYV